MANVLDIKRRIRSVVNTRQITKAMKTVSAAKLRRAQEAALAARPYSQMLTNVLKSLISRADIYDEVTGEPLHPLLAERPEKNILLIVVTGDKGLAGAFNTNILKIVTRFIESKPDQNIDVECIGRKGRDFMRRRFPVAPTKRSAEDVAAGAAPIQSEAPRAGRVQITGEYVGVLGKVDYNFVASLGQDVVARFADELIDEVDIGMAEEATEEERKRRVEAAKSTGVGVRPLDTHEVDEAAGKFATADVDYIYEQPPAQLFSELLPTYISIQIFHALMESVAAEHAARMTAMDAATNNASDMIDSLTLIMNRARQAKITKEIIEIVSGAAAQG
jgi:F-type H+-transporting ATPase subunit gamma